MEEVQINIRCAEAVAERLREITKAERIKSGDLLAKLLDCYQDSIKILSADTGIAETGIAETVKMLESRLLALESRFEELRAVEKGMDAPADKMSVAADLASSVVAENAGAETVEPVAVETVEAGAVNYSTEDWEKAVIALYKPGTTSFQHIAEQTYAAGFQNSNGNKRDRSFVKKVLDKAGKVG